MILDHYNIPVKKGLLKAALIVKLEECLIQLASTLPSSSTSTNNVETVHLTRHTVGLNNPSYYCYMNVWIQCLFSVIGEEILRTEATCAFVVQLQEFFVQMKTSELNVLTISRDLQNTFLFRDAQEDCMDIMQMIFPAEHLTMFNFGSTTRKSESDEKKFYVQNDDLTVMEVLTKEQQLWHDSTEFYGDSVHVSNFALDLAIKFEDNRAADVISLEDLIRDHFDHERIHINWYDESTPAIIQGCKEVLMKPVILTTPPNLILRIKLFYIMNERACKFALVSGIYIPVQLVFQDTMHVVVNYCS